MNRFVSPPLDQIDKLKTPLTSGEKLVLDIFLEYLPKDWEIYIQPHLNGLRPDFVLLNPKVGIAVYEVKDWNLDAMKYSVKKTQFGLHKLMAEKDGISFSVQKDNPVEKIKIYKDEIHNLYCPRTEQFAGYALITAGIIFPFSETSLIETLFRPFRSDYSMDTFPNYYPIVGKDIIESKNINKIFPESVRESSSVMNEKTARDLKNWLIEPEFSTEQREILKPNPKQSELIKTRTSTGYRKIKGPAGSGKSLVIAARASQAISEGKSVLVVTYNITLINYLMDLSVRWPRGDASTRENITWLNFHYWCKRVCLDTGHREDYNKLWKDIPENLSWEPGIQRNDEIAEDVLSNDLPSLVDKILTGPDKKETEHFDVILVDEGQDMKLEWWNCLRKVIKEGGEMVLAADTTQDIYEKVQYWTDEKMIGSGLVGGWNELDISYRMPDEMILQSGKFAKTFLPPGSVDIPQSLPGQREFFTMLKWVQITPGNACDIISDEIIQIAKHADPKIIAMSDITFLSADRRIGKAVIDKLATKNIKFLHTFDENTTNSRRQKIGFFKGSAKLKATTIHSFKGWESKIIVLYTGTNWSNKSRALIYTGLTRLKKSDVGSYITVINSLPELREYGRQWPDYIEK